MKQTAIQTREARSSPPASAKKWNDALKIHSGRNIPVGCSRREGFTCAGRVCNAAKQRACEAECSDYREMRWAWGEGGTWESLRRHSPMEVPKIILRAASCLDLPCSPRSHAKLSSMSRRAQLPLGLRTRSANFIPTIKRVICARFYY